MRWRYSLVGALMCAVVAGTVAGCGATAPKAATVVPTTAFTWADFAGPFMIKAGIAEGYFRKLHVTFTTISTGPGALPLLENGTLAGIDDLGGPVPPIAASRGVGMKIVWVDGSDSEALVVKPSITTASELVGQKIAVPIGSVAQYLLDKYLSSHGVAASKVDLVNVPPASMPGAYKAGEIAGAWIWAPFWSAMEAEGAHAIGHAYSEDVVGVSSQFVAAHPAVVQAVVCAYYNTYKAYQHDPTATYTAIAKAANESVAVVKGLIPPVTIAPADQVTPRLLGTSKTPSELATYLYDVGLWLAGNGSIPSAPSLRTMQKMFDPTFAENAISGKC